MKVKNMFSRMVNFATTSSRRRERWSKASQAKSQVKLILQHLETDKIATATVIKYLKNTITNQVFAGEDSTLLAGELYEHMCMKCALGLIQRFCECVLNNFHRLVRERSFADLPSHVQEAVASLVFASRRCGSVQAGESLELLRELFRERYGGAEGENVLDCKVNERLRNEFLCELKLSDDVKERLAKLVAKRCDLRLKFVTQEEGQEMEENVEN